VEQVPAADIPWGPTGQLVFDRTYSRVKPDGSRESWPETVERVVDGNLALVDSRHHWPMERDDLIAYMTSFKVLPGGRHLWASGVKDAQHLFNCWCAGWGDKVSDHFGFMFLRLMEGGGVGTNYSNRFLKRYPALHLQDIEVNIVCDNEHPDYQALVEEGVLSTRYVPEWAGAYVIEDTREGWAAALVDLIDTHYRDSVAHNRRVYDVSRVRPAGAKVRTFGGRASGPLPLARMMLDVNEVLTDLAVFNAPLDGLAAMEIDHAIAQCVVAGGVRRSARMSVMHWRDDQIPEFLAAKRRDGENWTTNISVEVDDDFWQLIDPDIQPGEDASAEFSWARMVWEAMLAGMAENGEPGWWDSSLSNMGEPNPVVTVNPCGEIALMEWEPCNLGHVNLAAFVKDNSKFDHLGLVYAHSLMTRFLIRATFAPLADARSREVVDRNRRIGLGHFGVASALAMIGKLYSEASRDKQFRGMLDELSEVVDRAASEYAHELRIPKPVKTRTVAPTGTVAKLAGVTEGIHPVFAQYFIRRVRFNTANRDEMAMVDAAAAQGFHVEPDVCAPNTLVVSYPMQDRLLAEVAERFGPRKAEQLVQQVSSLTLFEQLLMQSLYQNHWADNAVSFTASLTGDARKRLGDTLFHFGGDLKGTTIFPELSRAQAPYQRITREEYESYSAALVSVGDGVNEECRAGCPVR